MYINFQQIRVSRSVKTVHTNILANSRQLPIVIKKELIRPISDLHHRTMYMDINFQQIRVIRSVKTVHANIFANNRKLQKFAREKSTKNLY